jgi:hypothetical protein
MKRALALLLLIALPAFPQTTTVPASGTARRVVKGAAVPGTCVVGDLFFQTATLIATHECTAANTWTPVGVAGAAGTFTTGPASSTDNVLPRFDGTTGKLLQNGVIASADHSGDLTGPSALTTTTGIGVAFTNQPANDGIEVLSSNAADTGTVTLIGTTNGTDTVVVENVVLNGTTQVSSVKVDWGVLLAAKLSASQAGTVTIREASANATIVTLATTVVAAGVETVSAGNQPAWNRTVSLVSNGATTKQLGLRGTNTVGTTIYDSQALTGTTTVLSNSAFVTITEIYTGDLEATRTATATAAAGIGVDRVSGTLTLGGGRLVINNIIAPTIAGTGAGTTATYTLGAGSSDASGHAVITAGGASIAALGTVTITFSSGNYGGNSSVVCQAGLQNNSGTWNVRATAINQSSSLTNYVINWDNNAVALTTGQIYLVSYSCLGK